MAPKLSLFYTLALLATLFTIVLPPSVEANSMASHARMLRKRAAPNLIRDVTGPEVPVIGAGADPNAPTNTGANNGDGTASVTDTKTIVSPSGSGPAAANPTNSNPFSVGISLPGVGSSTPSASALPSASSSANAISSTFSSTSSTITSATPANSITSSSSTSITLETVFASQSSQQPSASASSTNTSSAASNDPSPLGKNTIIAIAVIGACVGGAIVIWTVIRKWKFAPSDEFGDRLNPIDWRPTSVSDKDIAGKEKFGDNLEGTGVGHRRNGSRGSNRSFVSADAHSMRNTPTPAPGGNTMIPDLPAHDFTAGAAFGNGNLAPVGGYADLRRGPSPTPGEGFYRGYGATQFGQNGY